jgi:type VI secretion system protein ImpG
VDPNGSSRRALHQLFEEELQYLQELGSEFAKVHPKIAGRLAWETKDTEVADPYVQRLRESFAFMSARVRQKLEGEFPKFTQHLLECLYPGALEPIPSMAVVRMEPELSEGSLNDGVVVPRGAALRSAPVRGQQSTCDFRTGHDVRLWPVDVAELEYRTLNGSAAGTPLPALPEIRSGAARAAIRLRLRTTTGVRFNQLPLERLLLHFPVSRPSCFKLHELVSGSTICIVPMTSLGAAPSSGEPIRWPSVRPIGFDEEHALLPSSPRGFSAFRRIQEYAVLPARFLFVELLGLGPAVRAAAATELELWIVLGQSDANLVTAVNAADVALHCTTAINLFAQRTDRVPLNDREYEYHLVPDRARPGDLEIVAVTKVTGHGDSGAAPIEFEPLYGTRDRRRRRGSAYFTVRRVPRLLSERESSDGSGSGYTGSEVYVSIVDQEEAPYRADLRQLAVEALCTNRDLALRLPPPGTGKTDFTIVSGAPVRAIRTLAGPTDPRPAPAESRSAWNLIGQLSNNHLGWIEAEGGAGAAVVSELLGLMASSSTDAGGREREGIRSVTSRPVVRRLTENGATAWVRGHEVTLTFADAAFAGGSAYLLASVLEHLLGRQTSINSFVQVVARTLERGEIGRWPARSGERRAW